MSVPLTPLERYRRKRFTPREKAEILQEWEAMGNAIAVAKKYRIHLMTLRRWRKDLDQVGAELLKGTQLRVDPRMKELEEENRKLRDTVDFLYREMIALRRKTNSV